ncbi:hypothetical protein BGZ54_007979 [Gamsiella multidivaricata]|nr:hypothetical protein BGZ54_007979 [Gamsiella multidivaricata]
MAPILEKILTGKETSPFILVKDTLEQSGQVLGLELLGNTPTDHTIVLVCAETAPDRLLSLVKGSHLKVIVDCYSNPLGWTDTYQASISKISSASGRTAAESHVTKIIPTSLRNIRRATKVIMELISSRSQESVFNQPTYAFSICMLDTSRIIAVYHEDVPDADSFFPDASKPFAANGLAHIATTLITLTNSEALRQDQEDLRRGMVAGNEFCYLTVHGNAWDSAICEIEHKRKSGKVARETNAYHLESPTGELVVVNVWDVVGEMPDIEKLDLEESQTADPAANLSFNLNLTEEQRRAKNDTVLPYLKTQESTGAIYYEPDKGDDFDDDDPDDDLTI